MSVRTFEKKSTELYLHLGTIHVWFARNNEQTVMVTSLNLRVYVPDLCVSILCPYVICLRIERTAYQLSKTATVLQTNQWRKPRASHHPAKQPEPTNRAQSSQTNSQVTEHSTRQSTKNAFIQLGIQPADHATNQPSNQPANQATKHPTTEATFSFGLEHVQGHGRVQDWGPVPVQLTAASLKVPVLYTTKCPETGSTH